MVFRKFAVLVPLLLVVSQGIAANNNQLGNPWSQSNSDDDAYNYFELVKNILQSGNQRNRQYEYEDFREKIREALRRDPTLSSPVECARACRKGERPKICYYHFTLELYTTLGGACDLCTPNATNQLEQTCQCVLADNVETTILTVNRMLPGPSIQVCEGDKIVVDVENKMEGMEATIHWHGIFQKGTPYYDGVPFVTQCPIHQGNTFRYQYLAGNAGTHFWHAHTGLQKMDGIHGPLIVRQAPQDDPNSHLYRYDLTTHVVHISDCMHHLGEEVFPGHRFNNTGQDPDCFLINGLGNYTDPETGESSNGALAVFNVTKGKTYRFRIIFSTATTCPSELTIESHNLTLIATDGEPIKPTVVTTIVAASAERFDFVLTANQSVGTYWIQLRALGPCVGDSLQQLAILRYAGGPDTPTSPAPTYADGLPLGIVVNPLDGLCTETRPDAICVNQLRNAKRVDPGILKEEPDVKIYLPFRFAAFDPEDLYQNGTFQTFVVPPGGNPTAAYVDGISYTHPPYPLLSQYNDNDEDQICYSNKTERCADTDICTCTHVIKIPYGAIVEFIIIDEIGIGVLHHPFHLHGFSFSVLAMGTPYNDTKIDADNCKQLDEDGGIERNFVDPPNKDTITIPSNGYAVIRFRADNPGFWLFHCHFLYHLTIGMDAVIHVGELEDLPPKPRGFPECGNYLPPITPIRKQY